MSEAIAERLRLDLGQVTGQITGVLRRQVGEVLRRSGLVVAMSGGVDSSVCAALAAAAVGPRRVLGLGLPERESDGQSLTLAREWATQLGIAFVVEDISAILEACGCYARRDAAIQRLVPDYGQGWRCKLVLEGGGLDSERLHVCYVAVQPPGGAVRKVRLPAREFREIVAATNFKQRVRKMLEYYHADRLNYLTTGTPNRLEYDQGFFVKLGDGAADIKLIAHLYKSQVYQLAEYLGVPEKVRKRSPTTDTYSLHQSQDEFYFSLPYEQMDLCLYGKNNGIPAAAVAELIGLSEEQVERVYKDIDVKRRSTLYLHSNPHLVAAIPEIRGI